MKSLTYILAVFDRSTADRVLVRKAASLARVLGARLELFLCDAEHAYALKRDYQPCDGTSAKREYTSQAISYLNDLRGAADLQGLEVSISASCESPLYEGIVHKVLQSQPDMVMKHAGGSALSSQATLDPNDWELMRKCPVTLLITRGRAWHAHPRFAAAVDVSAAEAQGLASSILDTSVMLSAAHGGDTDLLCSLPGAAAAEVRSTRAEAVRKLAEQSHVDVRGVRLFEGEPESTLPIALLEGQYDVLTLGALTHRPGVTALVGTLTSRLIDAVNCDFVLVKPEGFPALASQSDARIDRGRLEGAVG
jgi:universal stress protein E